MELKFFNIIPDLNERQSIIREVLSVLSGIKINDQSLKNLINDVYNDNFSFYLAEPFVYAVIYNRNKDLYAIVLERKKGNYILFSFEILAWIEKISDKITKDAIGKRLPPKIISCMEENLEIYPRTGQPKYMPRFERSWHEYYEEYLNKIKNNILEDLVVCLRIKDISIARKIAKKIVQLIPPNTFPPPPYSTISNNIHFGWPLQYDKYLYFMEWINTSHNLKWVVPDLGEIWMELLRFSILKNELSISGITEIVRKWLSARGDFKKFFIEKINEWAIKREYEYQYPVFILIMCLVRSLRKPRTMFSNFVLYDFKFLPGTPVYNIAKIVKNDQAKKAIIELKGYLYNANRYYFNLFIWERIDKIKNLAKVFHTYAVARKGDKETWEDLIKYWLLQFEDKYMLDLALDILENGLFIKTDEVCKAFEDWLKKQNLIDKINKGTVLIIYKADSSVDIVMKELRKNYLRDVKIDDSKWKYPSNLLLDNNGEPTDGELIKYFKKDTSIKYFKSGEEKLTDIIYIEDNVGTGTQASKKIKCLQEYLKYGGLKDVNIYYWTYTVDDINRLYKKLSELEIEISSESIIYIKDLQNPTHVKNQMFRIKELLMQKYANEQDVLLRKLQKMSKKILTARDSPIEWAKEDDSWLGYGGMGLLLVFEHGTPNNTLPILWRDSEDYFCLFPRSKPEEDNIEWRNIIEIFNKFGEKTL